MANFLKGLAGGIETGARLGEMMRQKEEREALQAAMKMTPQEVNQPDYQRAQAETQGLAAQDAAEFGLTPQDQARYAPQEPSKQYGLGGQTFNRMPTQPEIQQARYGAMADVIAERDPVRALLMRQEVTRMQREAEEAPLRRQALEQQVGLGKEQLTAVQEATATRGRQTAFSDWIAKNPNADFNTMVQKTRQLGMSPEEQFKAASNITGIEDAAFKSSQNAIRELVRNKSLDELLTAHKDSSLLDPNSHFEAIRGKGGQITLNRVDTATGKVIQPNVFAGNEAEAHKYLNMAAMSPEAVIDYTMNLRKTKAQIAEAEAGTGLKNAQAGLTGVHGQVYGAQLEGIKQAQAAREQVAALGDKYAALTPAQQNGPEGRGLIRQINIANVKAGGQVNYGPVEKPEPVMTRPQEKSWELLQKSEPWQRAEQKGDTAAMNKLLVGRGIDPALIGLPGDAGWVPKPAAPAAAPAAAPTAGLVQEDRTKYIREKGPRGGYVYTASPRGLTKAEYKAMDENK